MARIITLAVVALFLIVNTIATNRETKDAEGGHGGKVMQLDGGDLYYKDEGDREDRVPVKRAQA